MGNITSNALLSTVKRVAGRTKEMKFLDRTVTRQLLNTSPTIASMTPVIQSTQDFTRIGNEIDWVDWDFKFSIGVTNGIPSNNPRTRVILFQWHADSFSDQPSSPGMFASTTPDPVRAINYYYFRSKKIKVFYDKTFLANSEGGTDTQRHEIYIPHTRGTQKIYFNPTSGVAEGTNHLFVCIISDDVVGGSYISFTSRVRFTDS